MLAYTFEYYCKFYIQSDANIEEIMVNSLILILVKKRINYFLTIILETITNTKFKDKASNFLQNC